MYIKTHFTAKRIRAVAIILLCFLGVSFITVTLKTINSSQAEELIVPKIRFSGEYKIGDGQWEKVQKNEHISATKGDIMLKGYLELFDPSTDVVFGRVTEGTRVVFSLNHINLSVVTPQGLHIIDTENDYIGEDSCGFVWQTLEYMGEDGKIEMILHNPHLFGNESAVDNFLNNIFVDVGADTEKIVSEHGESERVLGIAFIIAAFVILGIGVFSAVIHFDFYKEILLGGLLIFCAGMYFIFSSSLVYFWSETLVFNTMTKGIVEMAYMLIMFIFVYGFLSEKLEKAGRILLVIYGGAVVLLNAAAFVTDLYFYDMTIIWAGLTCVAGLGFLVLIILSAMQEKFRLRLFNTFAVIGILAFFVDVFAIFRGVWQSGVASKGVFIVSFLVSTIVLLDYVPKNIHAVEKAKALENEKLLLNAQLAESRISTMISQIRPHFIYNTLGSIEQLCELDPPKAAQLVNDFSKYLRGNFGELDNPKLIRVSREIEHTKHYISIEKVRFPDIEFNLEFGAKDFSLPALTIQPIVENSIKHGIMKLSHGGRVNVKTYETEEAYCVCVEDNGVGFDVGKQADDGKKHIGLKNIRGRLEAMCLGRIEIESTPGKGTRVTVIIPKEGQE